MSNSIIKLFSIFSIFMVLSCSDYLDVPLPSDQLATETVFKSKSTIEGAVIGIHNSHATLVSPLDILNVGFLSDELFYPATAGSRQALAIANIDASNNTVNSWSHRYTTIYRANVVIENIATVPTSILSTADNNRLLGEALYLRAASYMYLVNIWGDVPLVLTTPLSDNITSPRAPIADVYKAIIADLEKARDLLPNAPPTSKDRINSRYQAEALLARAYLYLGRWADAETASTNVIANGKFELTPIADVFKRNSKETVFAFREVVNNAFFVDKSYFSSVLLADVNHALHTNILSKLETTDPRRTTWTRVQSGRTQLFKYVHTLTATATSNPQDQIEQRLAEVYLIRAEARAQQNKLAGENGAVADINVIRKRAQRSDIQVTSQGEILTAVEDERVRELFGEGHRWFDLKRTGKADSVLGSLSYKSANYKPHMKFMPIATSQIDANPNMKQTQGYN